MKRKFGEFVRATKVKNMFNEVKLKYLFYNAIIKYDVTHRSFFGSFVYSRLPLFPASVVA